MREKKNLLNEGTIRRFMTLANIGTIGQGFVQNLNEQEEFEEEEVPFEGDVEGMGMEDLGPEEEGLEDLGPEEEVGEGPVDIMSLVDAIADAITAETGVVVRAEEAGEEGEEFEELEGEEEMLGGEEMMPPEEEMMAEHYIRERVRQALLQEKIRHRAPSPMDQKAAQLYKARMQSIAKRVYDQSRVDVIAEAKVNAFSNEVERRVASRILKNKKK